MTDFQSFTIHPAVAADIPLLVELRLAQMQSMDQHDPTQLADLAAASEAYFRLHLPDGSYRAWLAEVEGAAAACGGLVIRQSPPTYHNLTGREGYILGMYTRPEFRRRGLATAIMHTILDHLRAEGIQRATLRASLEGRLVYEKLGFEQTSEMRLKL